MNGYIFNGQSFSPIYTYVVYVVIRKGLIIVLDMFKHFQHMQVYS